MKKCCYPLISRFQEWNLARMFKDWTPRRTKFGLNFIKKKKKRKKRAQNLALLISQATNHPPLILFPFHPVCFQMDLIISSCPALGTCFAGKKLVGHWTMPEEARKRKKPFLMRKTMLLRVYRLLLSNQCEFRNDFSSFFRRT